MKPLKRKDILVTEDIIPLSDFKAQASKILRIFKDQGRPVVITQNGKPAAVMISPEDFDRLQEREAFMASVGRGRADVKSGKVFSTKEVEKALDERFGKLK